MRSTSRCRVPGFIAVQDVAGNEAYTRAGDLHVDTSRAARDHRRAAGARRQWPDRGAAGHLGVASPPTAPSRWSRSASRRTRSPPSGASSSSTRRASTLARGADGLFRTSDGTPPEADATVQLASGVLESSNVNIAGCLVNMIELSRRFELQIKALHTAEETGQASAKLLQSS